MSVSPDYFEQLFGASDDPWSFRTRWYEKRKRELTLASLPRQRYQRVFEPACANGELSVQLAGRCDALLCQDLNAKAVELARQRLSGLHHVHVEQAGIPRQWPDGDFDLIVLSEVGYFLDVDDWHQVIENTLRSLGPAGGVLACHWLHPIEGCSQDGHDVHAALGERLHLHRLVRHEEADFLLEYWSRTATSIDLAETCQSLPGQ
ncbi:SAM-dependent methyltransferase [Pseudomonas sp. PSB11]|jgi:SAM-dependent methyltransferase|uniref:SAM-dependent methyltransferase n=1 Tax=Pseudomonas sp. PSB11 TaxID=2021969 RepID=UPI001660867C|nr:SAM-dependent methyltransferase [Pseudomonas sp. PSB11]MBD0678868.1 SAM-dependent methyltransferase [Pseudomonas sp. PSB11]